MSENIRVSEVSDILRKQLEGINTNVQLDEIGTVLQVSDGVVRIYGLRNAEANELLEFDNGIKAIVMNLEEDNVGAVLLGPTDRIKEGFIVKRTKRIASIRVGEGMLGRVIDPLGEPLDGKGLIGGELYEMPLERKAPGVIYRQPVNQPLQTGLKAVDAMIPIGRGQRELIIGDRQTGKTSIAIDTIINQRNNFSGRRPGVLYLCGYRSERIYRRFYRQYAPRVRCDGLHDCEVLQVERSRIGLTLAIRNIMSCTSFSYVLLRLIRFCFFLPAAPHNRVIHRTVLAERIDDRSDRRSFLTDSHIDTVHRIACQEVIALIDNRINRDRGLSCLTVTDNQLTLSASDRDHGVYCLQTGL